MDPNYRLRRRYDQLWSSSIPQIRRGNVEIDGVLASGVPDQRRGLTLVARPSPAVRTKVIAFLDELREIEPDQYYCPPSDLHLTVLSVFGVTADYEPFLAQTAEFVSAVDAVISGMKSIKVSFTGVTTSLAAVLIQGFLMDDTLNRFRDDLRGELQRRGLTKGLDLRYRLETAHMTVLRFIAKLRRGEELAKLLEQSRSRVFGSTTITALDLVQNDWYMSLGTLKTVKHYRVCR